MRPTSPKVGRNDPCPCGSGQKFKRCHGSPLLEEVVPRPVLPFTTEMRVQLDRLKAKELQRQYQQGLGNPIISIEHNGTRIVAVKDKLIHSPAETTKTFHDFLLKYVKGKFGQEWADGQIALPEAERHPFFQWSMHVHSEMTRSRAAQNGAIFNSAMTAGIAAFYRLAYDLYALEHNAEVQEKLLGRLRLAKSFLATQYEVFVAAALIRAGFTIEFENEDDRNSTHVEFTATHKKTGREFSVEAKYRDSADLRIGRRLHRALTKDAHHQRVVFIELNAPDADVSRPVQNAVRFMRRYENGSGKLLPAAYVFLTNIPWHQDLGVPAVGCGIPEAFRIPEFQSGTQFPSVRAMIDARDRHQEMHDLSASLRDHWEIPATFDGEIPEFAFGQVEVPRLLIGNTYQMPGPDGRHVPAVLESATVNEAEKKVYCAVATQDDKRFIVTCPLTDAELAAWRRHPDTFFGQIGQRKTTSESPLELYDFFHNGYRDTPRERLLEFMNEAPDAIDLATLGQAALACIYAERCTEFALRQQAQEREKRLIKGITEKE